MEILSLRLLLAFCCLIIGTIRIIGFSLGASAKGEPLMYGPDIDMIIPDICLLSAYPLALIWLWNPGLIHFADLDFPPDLRVIGIGIEFSGILLLMAAHLSLGRCYSPNLVVKKGQTIVSSGLYHFIRHPIYLSEILIFVGAFLISSNWLFLAGLSAILWISVFRPLREEKMMKDAFRQSYIDYMKKTGRFFPKFKRL